MPRLNPILLSFLLALAVPAGAAGEERAVREPPLNLSLPRDALHAPGTPQIDERIERNLIAPSHRGGDANEWRPHPSLPYGAGYEHRHREMGGAGAGSAPGGRGGRRGR